MRLPDPGRSRVILVGTARYPGDDRLPDLPAVLGNVTGLAEHLTREDFGGFAARHCTVITDPDNSHQLGSRMAEIAEQAEDTLLVYYAGHGLVDDDGALYLGLSSTRAQRVAYSAMPLTMIDRVFRESPAIHNILILDCCFSGRAIEAMADPGSVVSGQIDIPGRYTLTSSAANETANAPLGAPHTAFTGELLRLLGDGLTDGPEFLTLAQIYRHLLRALNARGLPKPQRRGGGTVDDLALARNVAWTTGPHTVLPPAVARALREPVPQDRAEAIGMLVTLVKGSEPLLARAALEALTALTDDDSRSLASKATEALRDLRGQPAARPAPPPEPSVAPPAEPRAPERPKADEPPRRQLTSVGIDFGTTNSALATLENRSPFLVPNAEGTPTTPSVVAFAKSGEVFVGQSAKNQAVTNADRTFRSIKRRIGTDWKSPPIDGRRYTAQEIAARVLAKLKHDAEAGLNARITDVVLTVPAYFTDHQRQATKEAAEIAGLNVLRLLSEPTAAALASGLGTTDADVTVLVCDLGGGTFDVSLLECGMGIFEVKATSGDNELGGDDWDQRIVDHIAARFRRARGIDLQADRMALQRLREAAEQAKIALSSVQRTTIALPYITVSAEKEPLHLDEALTRAELESITADLLDRVRGPVTDVLREAGITAAQIDHVLFAGGAARMPAFLALVRELLDGATPKQRFSSNEIVAAGAALQAGVLRGEVQDTLLLDVNPVSLGIETKGGVFTRVIPRNTTLPIKRSEIFTTAEDNQPSIQVSVYQGEREIAKENRHLGTFELTGLPPAPRGVPQFEVTFDLDPNGVMHVSARDLGTGREQSLAISGGVGLSRDEIGRMVRDAERWTEEDQRRREEAELRNRAETSIYQLEAFIREHGGKFPFTMQGEARQAIDVLRTALAGTDSEAIRTAAADLDQVSQQIGVAIYRQRPSL